MGTDPATCTTQPDPAARPAREQGGVRLIDLVLSGALRLGAGAAEGPDRAGPPGP